MKTQNIFESKDEEGRIFRIKIELSLQEKQNICNLYDCQDKEVLRKIKLADFGDENTYGIIFYNNDNSIEYYLSINDYMDLINIKPQQNILLNENDIVIKEVILEKFNEIFNEIM